MTHAVHLTTAHSTFDPRIFHKECKSLAKAGYSVTLLCHHDANETVDGVDIRSLGTANSRLERWQNIPKTARKARYLDADIYHIHDPELLPVGVYLGKRTEARIIYDLHENYKNKILHREWIPWPLKPPLRLSYPFVQNVLFTQFDAIITATEWLTDSLSHLDVTTIHNFPRRAAIPSEDDVTSVSSSHDLQLVYVGGVSRSRGLFRMIDLICNLNAAGLDTGLWVVGPATTEDVVSSAHERLDSNGLTPHVDFMGRVDYPEIFPYLYGADLGLAILNPEDCKGAIPTKIFDYMATGLPIVASPMDATEKYLPSECGLVVPFEDMDEAAAKILEVEKSGFEAFHQQSKNYIKTKFSWEREQEKLLSLYEYV